MQPSMDKSRESRESSNNPPKQNQMPYPPTQNGSENLKALKVG